MTEKLYWADPLATTFTAAGARLDAFEGKPSVVLEQTLFYPEGGGQLGDAGTLVVGGSALAVVDTQIAADGTIHHVLAEAPTTALEGAVSGTIDGARRRDHMAQHTGQHVLSRALLDATETPTVSARLGASACTIDVARPSLADAQLHAAEDLANAIVTSDAVVRAFFPTPEELASIDLRKQPNVEKSAAGVRLVAIEGFDTTPCGGTHVTRTGQIGPIRIVATEKHKGMTRITFHCGRRALADARQRHAALAAAAAELSCAALDVPAGVAKLRAELKAARAQVDAARAELATRIARALREALPEGPGPHVVPVLREADDLPALRALAGELAGDPRVLALAAGRDASGELLLVVQRGSGLSSFDCGAFVQGQAKARSGRGGGRPERAEGRFPGATSLDDLVRSTGLGA